MATLKYGIGVLLSKSLRQTVCPCRHGIMTNLNMKYSTEKKKSWKFWGKKESEVEAISEVESEAESKRRYALSIEEEAREEYIQSQRNKSKLSASHRQIVKGHPPYKGIMFEYNSEEQSKEFKRKMLAKYGSRSGVDPGIAWPTNEEIELAKEWEKVYQPDPLKDMINKAWDEEKQKKEARIQKEMKITENLKRMEKQMTQWQERLNSKQKMADAETKRREKVLAELKQELGYDVNPHDRHMVERIAEKEKLLIKEEKEAKKAAKKEKMEQKHKKLAEEK